MRQFCHVFQQAALEVYWQIGENDLGVRLIASAIEQVKFDCVRESSMQSICGMLVRLFFSFGGVYS